VSRNDFVNRRSEKTVRIAFDLHHKSHIYCGKGSAYASTPAYAGNAHSAYAAISISRHNAFGHHSSTTTATWKRKRSRILLTDWGGATALGTNDKLRNMVVCKDLLAQLRRGVLERRFLSEGAFDVCFIFTRSLPGLIAVFVAERVIGTT
jgi:hypothetical protein